MALVVKQDESTGSGSSCLAGTIGSLSVVDGCASSVQTTRDRRLGTVRVLARIVRQVIVLKIQYVIYAKSYRYTAE
jgi:hypothetical protein